MRKPAIILLAAASVLMTAANLPAQSQPERLYQAIVKEGFLHKKRELGRQLGRLGTPEAKERLLKLLDDDHYWNQYAAIDGLFLYDQPDIRRRLVRELMDNHMVRSEIASGLKTRMPSFAGEVAEAYRQEAEEKKRENLMDDAAATRTREAEVFLKTIVADRASPDRRKAAGQLAKGYPDNYQYFSGLVEDPEVRIVALGFLAERGSARDLPLFTGILEKGGEDAEVVVAYQAVAKWGDQELKRRTYLTALSSGNEVLARGGMASFRALYDAEISAGLGRLAKSAREQRTRMQAGVRLAELGRTEAVPFLVPLLDEEYREHQSATFNAIASIMTAGIWTVLDGLSQSFNRRSFDNSRSAILAGLRRITGTDAGTSYQSWKEWAVLHGHVIRGENIVQQLFASDRVRRNRAAEAGAVLLGFRSARDYAEKRRVGGGEHDLALALARELAEKGFMKEAAE
jgi:HEAT repeat protein